MPIRVEKAPPNLKIAWPTDSLTGEEIGLVASGRVQRPLRLLIAQAIVDESAYLWESQSKIDPSTRLGRSDSDLAINSGYAEVGKVILIAGSKPSDQVTDILKRDPTGSALLNNRLREMRGTGRLDFEAIGFERGMERFKDFYNQAVRGGIRSDRRGPGDLLREWVELPVLRVVTGARRAFSGARS